MYAYSERPGTLAARKLEDDVPRGDQKEKAAEIIDLQREHGLYAPNNIWKRWKRF